MKAEGIKTVGNVITNAIKGSAKAEAAKTSEVVKGGEKLMAAGQDAAAVQGRAMVKPYVKPEMEAVKMEKQNLKAASGYDEGGRGGRYRSEVNSSNSPWDDELFLS